MKKNEEFRLNYQVFEDALPQNLSNKNIEDLIAFYIQGICLDDERDITDGIELFIERYGNQNTIQYLNKLIDKTTDNYVVNKLIGLIEIINSSSK